MGAGAVREQDNVLKEYRARLRFFRQHGYDLLKARAFVIKKAGIRGGEVLEVGTGRGHLAIGLARRGIRFTTIDLDEGAQAFTKRILRARGLLSCATFRRMNAERLSFRDGSFDHVISVNFIHHASRPERCIREMVRVARRSVIIADLNRRGAAIMDRVHRMNGREHERSKMTLTEVKIYLDRSGLSVKVYRDTCQTVLVATKG